MKEWIVSLIQYAVSNYQTILVGGSIVVGVVIFLTGILKKFLFNKIQNKLARKIVLSFFSLVLAIPATLGIALYNKMDMNYFWVFYAINAVSTILIYWFYENTGLRDLLSLIGENTVSKLLRAIFKSGGSVEGITKGLEDTMGEIDKDTRHLLKESKYQEDDLKNL